MMSLIKKIVNVKPTLNFHNKETAKTSRSLGKNLK